jgi:biotin synthase
MFKKADLLFNRAVNGTFDSSDLDTVIAWPLEELPVLWAATDKIRCHFFTNTVTPCSIMNVKSGGCTEDCAFCAQSSHSQTGVPVKPLAGADEIVEACRKARENNLDFCVVSSGRRLSPADIDRIADSVRKCGGNMHASLGILSEADFAKLRDAGVVCYNHNLESSREFFPKIVTSHNWDQRVETVRLAKKSGMHVCCGGIFGVGESWEDRKSLCLTLKELDVDTIPLNFFNPIPGTRAPAPSESPMELLKIVSLFRIGLPSKTIKVCGGREFHLGRLQPLIFLAGANGYISGGYLTTSGDGVDADDTMIKSLSLCKTEK